MAIISDIFSAVGAVITGFSTSLASSVSSVISIFYDSTGNALTTVGALLTIALGAGLVWFAVRLLMRLVRARG